MVNGLSISGVSKQFTNPQGEVITALSNVDLDIAPGSFISLIGPSGCGKSTLLRLIAGLIQPDSGTLALDGAPITKPGSDRGFMFQDHTLFPWLTIYDNIAFGLRAQGVFQEKEASVKEFIDLVGLTGFEKYYPHQLSGGMCQRASLARALVGHPKVLLLDEPLGALDLKLRKDMQNELKHIQQAMEITFVYVTHDQEEALTMSDTVVVMDKGKIQQIGTPEDIYNEPRNAFVADFIGESNIIDGIMRADGVVEIFNRRFQCLDGGFAPDEAVDVVIRPEDVDIVPEDQGQLKGTVTNVTFKGMQYDIIVDFYGFKWLIQTTDLSPVGSRIGIKIDPDGIHVMKKSEYSGLFGDYSSYSEEYEEISDATFDPEDEDQEGGDEE